MGWAILGFPPLLIAGLLTYPHPGACAVEGKQEIDTQFIFGFTSGADVGELGEKEIEHETIARLNKRGGSYVGLSDQTRAEFVPVQNLGLELGLPIVYYDIAGVSGFDNVHGEPSTAST